MRAFVLRSPRRTPASDPVLEALHRAFGDPSDEPEGDGAEMPPAPPQDHGETTIYQRTRRLVFVDMDPREAPGSAPSRDDLAQIAEMAEQERRLEMEEMLARQAAYLEVHGRRATLKAGLAGVAFGLGVALLARHLPAPQPWTLTD